MVKESKINFDTKLRQSTTVFEFAKVYPLLFNQKYFGFKKSNF